MPGARGNILGRGPRHSVILGGPFYLRTYINKWHINQAGLNYTIVDCSSPNGFHLTYGSSSCLKRTFNTHFFLAPHRRCPDQQCVQWLWTLYRRGKVRFWMCSLRGVRRSWPRWCWLGKLLEGLWSGEPSLDRTSSPKWKARTQERILLERESEVHPWRRADGYPFHGELRNVLSNLFFRDTRMDCIVN